MKSLLFSIALLSLLTNCINAQQYQPEDVVYSAGQAQLKYKHVMAYIDLEMEGEDPARLNDQSYMQALVAECLEEFVEDPIAIVEDLEVHYSAMMMGAGFLSNSNNTVASTNVRQNVSGSNQQQVSGSGFTSANNSQMKQLLSGSVLYYTATEHHNGFTIQSTQYMHLCPNGTAHLYQNSGGGGGSITALSQMEYQESFAWDVIEQNGATYFHFSMQGASQNLFMRIINQKIEIQALGVFSIQQGGAQCY